MSEATRKELEFTDWYQHLHTKEYNEIGNWKIRSFALEHDSDNTGFLIEHKETLQRTCYITDSGFCRSNPIGVHHLIIECNYQDELLKSEEMEDRFRRVKSTHMSLERLLSWLSKIDKSVMHKIILVHLSDRNSNEQAMVSAVQEFTGIQTYAAHNGETIDLSDVPF
jgi:ribonuclease BN (tRNA processing enzyme)